MNQQLTLSLKKKVTNKTLVKRFPKLSSDFPRT